MPSRWWLLVQAVFWRILMRIGMFLHTLGLGAPRPAFVRCIKFDHDAKRKVDLYFYCPPEYYEYQRHRQGPPLPVVVNFHGGGFVLGCATDDIFWFKAVMEQAQAVVVSVAYRRGPEHPFPAAVDDGVEALLYLTKHADVLGIDTSRMSLTGFSAGGNLAFAVPLRLQDRLQQLQQQQRSDCSSDLLQLDTKTSKDLVQVAEMEISPPATPTIVSIFSWYPILDFLTSREHRRAASVFPDKTLPKCFTSLFDESYLPDHAERASPFASVERAPDALLNEGLPHDIFVYMCEWDMLLHEGQRFVRRLQGMRKNVRSMMVEKVPHAWDKSPNPFRDQAKVDMLYTEACSEMKVIF
ncbi:hypothetical protein VTN31DRAFT_1813 [Thermomyces dupontii]|uniref:uncharacterized protein n=1 Tax=Talaromyces thermophilus TaxID=28565 RepID=UPI003744A44E